MVASSSVFKLTLIPDPTTALLHIGESLVHSTTTVLVDGMVRHFFETVELMGV